MENPVLPAAAAVTEKHSSRLSGNNNAFTSGILLTLTTVAAAWVRLHALAGRGLWLDEAISVFISQNRLSALFRIVRDGEIYMALYYFLLHWWLVFGDSEFTVRLLSVIFSVASIPFAFAAGSRLFGRAAGLIAAGLLAFSSFHIRFAQEAHSYALTVLLAIISTWLLVRNLQDLEKASWRTYGVVLSLMVYSHLYALSVVIAHCAAVLCLPRGRVPWKSLAGSALWFLCLSLPLALAALRILARGNPVGWGASGGFSDLPGFVVLLAGNRGNLLVVLDLLMLAALIFNTVRIRRAGRAGEGWPTFLVLLWFLVPLLIAVAVAEIWPPFVARYLLPCLPAFLLGVGAGLTCIRPRSVAWTLGSAIFVLNLAAIPACYHLSGVLEDWRVISSEILGQAEPGDGISYHPDYARIPFEYYRARRVPAAVWPKDIAVGAGSSSAPVERADNSQETPIAVPVPAKRFWVVYHHPTPLTPESRRELAAHLHSWRDKGWRLLQAQEYPMVVVMFFAASSDQAVSLKELPSLFQPANAGNPHR